MKISKQARRDAKSIFHICKANGLLDENRVRTAITQVIARKPRGYVGILSHLERLVKLDVARRTAVVESPIPLAPAFQEGLKSNLARRHGAGLNVSFVQNPALLGGLRIKVGSDVYDGSVQARLAALETSL
jgi:F-type H+-transporting ATPase subunit delta